MFSSIGISDLKAEASKTKKVYKIKYTVNLLPRAGEYITYEKDLETE